MRRAGSEVDDAQLDRECRAETHVVTSIVLRADAGRGTLVRREANMIGESRFGSRTHEWYKIVRCVDVN